MSASIITTEILNKLAKGEGHNCRLCGKWMAITENYGCVFVGRGFCLNCAQTLWKELGK